ncbi:MAG: hypothetical protein A2V64_09220 [Bacteroidetes bacterium RBG_13_43_22]|nr:MAG: hypothetical protein A2V64_09220 [Bacteroidetes bacterium RBG_13_43_22]
MKKDNNDLAGCIFLFSVFLSGVVFGLFFWNRIVLPFHNPWGVTGPLTVIEYNPANNLIRFIVLILFPVLLLSIIYLFDIRKINIITFGKNSFYEGYYNISPDFTTTTKTIFTVLIILFSVLIAIYISYPGQFDPFHEGESLGPAMSYLAGKTPYKDFLFCHGVYQDPLRSVIAFKFFGKSIGSVRTLESITHIFSMVLLSLFITKIYRGNYLFSFASVILLFFINNIFFLNLILPKLPESLALINLSRDITLYSFLITVALLHSSITRHDISARRFFIIVFLFSFIPLAAFGYSIDRGFYLFAAYLIISPVLYLFFFRKSAFRIHYLISSLLGILSAIILLLFLLRGNPGEFFKYTFLIMPKYKELLDGDVYPVFRLPFLMICIFIAANTFWVGYKFIQELHQNNNQITITIRKFTEKYLIELCLLVLSVFFFRGALGRIDWHHVVKSSHITYILSIYIIFRHYLYRYYLNKRLNYAMIFIVLFISVFLISRIIKENLISRSFPLETEDSKFIPENYKATISYLKNNLSSKENFFTMTSEASWYYFIDKPCPTRFPVVWFASPSFYQEEIVRDLKMNNVKFILYRNNSWYNAIDGFDNETRFPIIMGYIEENYEFFKKFDNNEIWINKLPQP